MKKFLVLYMAPMSGAEQMKNADPERAKKGMDMWMSWMQKAGSAIVDGGAPLGESMHVGPTEHPKMDVHVSGYSIMQAEDAEALKKMLSDHPHLMMEKSCIEVLEMMPMPGM